MKIINIVPGFGGTFYCGNCLRDSAYAQSLKKAGHDATILPVYLPLTMNQPHDQEETPVFYGAVNIYLKQQFPILRKMPHWMENLFNSEPLLKYASSKAGSTRAEGMEALTESMLLGRDGNQAKELDELVHYLKHHAKPDVVHFSNALLIGMAKQIKEEAGIPVACSLQDEDVWIDAMKPEYQPHMWDLMAEKAKDIDTFIAVSDYFAGLMQSKLKIPDSKLKVVHIGIDPSLYTYHQPQVHPPTIGYLSRICEENGFEVLVDAFILLKKNPQWKSLKLKATGGKTGDDKSFIKHQQKKLKQENLLDEVEFIDDFSFDSVRRFFQEITLLSVPVLKGEAFGLYQIESLASGIPIVQPNLGAFPEIIEKSRGGVIYHPNTPEALADALHQTLSNEQRVLEMSQKGRKAVEEHFDSGKLIRQMIEIYKNVGK